MPKKYVIQLDEKSMCPRCHMPVDLLIAASGFGDAFYICWHCEVVSQVGVGPVPRDQEEDEHAGIGDGD